LTPDEIKRISGRGGASGVGVNAFFQGGLIVDVGHHESSEDSFVPSSARQGSVTPPMAIRLPFPEQWRIHLFLPNGLIYEGDGEVAFFQHNTPISAEEVFRVMAAVYHGLVPAFIDNDIRLLKRAITDVHSTGFKKRELQGQTAEVSYLLDLLNGQDLFAAGMSSMGPLIYAIAPASASDVIERITGSIQEATSAVYLGMYKGRNAGCQINEKR
jgi:beta-ribofuranosylaminobenzene 5'-phosphate synthase